VSSESDSTTGGTTDVTPVRARPWFSRPWVLVACGLVLLLAFLVWDGIRLARAATDLRAAVTQIDADSGFAALHADLVSIQTPLAEVAARGNHAWWRPALWIGFGVDGGNAVAALARESALALPFTAEAVNQLDQALGGGLASIDVEGLTRARDQLLQVRPHVLSAAALADDLAASRFAGRVQPYVTALRGAPDVVTQTLAGLDVLSTALTGERQWVVVAENTAEARGTGGIVGAYALITTTDGRISVDQVGPNSDLRSMDAPPIKISDEFDALYGDDPGIWQNANLSPHFPDGARVMSALWQEQFGRAPSGVISVDPHVLAAILSATGPVDDGFGLQVDSANAVATTLSTAYQRFDELPAGQTIRKDYLAAIFASTLRKMLAPGTDPVALVTALRKPLADGRVLAWSSDAQVQAAIEAAGVAGRIDETAEDTFRVVVINSAGNKMDYYLEREVVLETVSCSPRVVRLTARFRLAVPEDEVLVDYVAGRLDLGTNRSQGGSSSIRVNIYAPTESELMEVAVDGESALALMATEHGHQVTALTMELAARQWHVVEADIELFSARALRLATQPLVRDEMRSVTDSCA
jgi:hypothetical protein